jgi:hypothetical protein
MNQVEGFVDVAEMIDRVGHDHATPHVAGKKTRNARDIPPDRGSDGMVSMTNLADYLLPVCGGKDHGGKLLWKAAKIAKATKVRQRTAALVSPAGGPHQ